MRHKPYGPYEAIVKPILGWLLALIFVLLFWWLYIVLAVLIHIKLGSPVLFTQDSVLIPMINEAVSIYAEGVATVEDIDTAMKLGANHPMGPLALGNLIGLDVVLAILNIMLKETGNNRYLPQPMLKKMVREKKLGRKNWRRIL